MQTAPMAGRRANPICPQRPLDLAMNTGLVSPNALLPILGAALLGGTSLFARAEHDSSPTVSALTIEEAIEAAKRCVVERKVDLTGSFVESAQLQRSPSDDRGSIWLVTCAQSRPVKGGQVYVSVLQTRTCEIRYG